MYADDIVVLTESVKKAQSQMGLLSDWCLWWGMKANIKKSQVIHYHNQQKPRCQTPIQLLGQDIQYVDNNKYPDCWVNEFGNNAKTVEALTSAASRSYGRIVGMFRKLGDMGYNSFISLWGLGHFVNKVDLLMS